MKRVLILLCALLLFVCGCSTVNKGSSETPSKPIVVMPNEQTAATVNGYKNENINTNIEYIVNKSSKKFHLPDCSYAGGIKDENKGIFYNRSDLIKDGYSPCGSCKP